MSGDIFDTGLGGTNLLDQPIGNTSAATRAAARRMIARHVPTADHSTVLQALGLAPYDGGRGSRRVAGSSKLTADQVLELRRMRYEQGVSMQKIAEHFGIARSTACRLAPTRDVD